MANSTLVEFDSVTIEAAPPYESGLTGVSLRLGAGELAVIRMEDGQPRVPLADAAEGLVEPDSGAIRFLGEDWRSLGPDRAAACRGQVGRVFEQHGWISNLDMDENITLSQRHHTSRPEEEIVREAEQLAREFGLHELPRVRPAVLKQSELRRAEWIRAFLGAPKLVILEDPTRDAPSGAIPLLAGAVERACARGAAVLWFVKDPRAVSAASKVASVRFEIQGTNVVALKGSA